MRHVVRARGFWPLVLVSVGVVLIAETPAEAQARRGGRGLGTNLPAGRSDDTGGRFSNADRPYSPRIGRDRDTGFAPGQAAAGEPSPFSPLFNGTANRQVRRYRGDNNEFNFQVGPSGLNVGSNAMSPSMGFTIDKVQEGYYIPGYGVNGGFAAPERVHGGYHTPGWGVMGGMGNFNGAGATQQVQGGTYLPGFGVGSGPAVIGNPGGPAVLGNFGNPAAGVAPAVTGASVNGGTYIPGFGVSGGR